MNNERRPPMGQREGRDARGPRRPGVPGQRAAGPQGGPRHPQHGGGQGGPRKFGGPARPGGPRKFGGPGKPGGRPGGGRPGGGARRPPSVHEEETDEILSGPVEANYLRELVAARTPIEVKLRNGQTHSGTIEYWDQRFIRLTPESGPNLFIFKHDIKYLLEK